MKKKNIFEGSIFGDKFLTRNNNVGILSTYYPQAQRALLSFDKLNVKYMYQFDGVCLSNLDKDENFNIISKY